MKNQAFKVNIKTVWVLAIASPLLMIMAINELKSGPILSVVPVSFLLLFVAKWIIIVNDMVENKLYNKSMWIISMFILPEIASIAYLIQRDKLVKFDH